MKKGEVSLIPLTEANLAAEFHKAQYGYENSLDEPFVEWSELCARLEAENKTLRSIVNGYKEIVADQRNMLDQKCTQVDRCIKIIEDYKKLLNNVTR